MNTKTIEKIKEKYIIKKYPNKVKEYMKKVKIIHLKDKKQKELKKINKYATLICWENIDFGDEGLTPDIDNGSIIYVLFIDDIPYAFIIYDKLKKYNNININFLCSMDKVDMNKIIKDNPYVKLNMGSMLLEIAIEHAKKIKSNIIRLETTQEGFDFYKKKFGFIKYDNDYDIGNKPITEDEPIIMENYDTRDYLLMKLFSWSKKKNKDVIYNNMSITENDKNKIKKTMEDLKEEKKEKKEMKEKKKQKEKKGKMKKSDLVKELKRRGFIKLSKLKKNNLDELLNADKEGIWLPIYILRHRNTTYLKKMIKKFGGKKYSNLKRDDLIVYLQSIAGDGIYRPFKIKKEQFRKEIKKKVLERKRKSPEYIANKEKNKEKIEKAKQRRREKIEKEKKKQKFFKEIRQKAYSIKEQRKAKENVRKRLNNMVVYSGKFGDYEIKKLNKKKKEAAEKKSLLDELTNLRGYKPSRFYDMNTPLKNIKAELKKGKDVIKKKLKAYDAMMKEEKRKQKIQQKRNKKLLKDINEAKKKIITKDLKKKITELEKKINKDLDLGKVVKKKKNKKNKK